MALQHCAGLVGRPLDEDGRRNAQSVDKNAEVEVMPEGLEVPGHDGEVAPVTKLATLLKLMQDMPSSIRPHPSRSPETLKACDKEAELTSPPTPPSPERRTRGKSGSSEDSDSLPRNPPPTSPCSPTMLDVALVETQKSPTERSCLGHTHTGDAQACYHPPMWLNSAARTYTSTHVTHANQQLIAPSQPTVPAQGGCQPGEEEKPSWSRLEDISPPSTTRVYLQREHSTAGSLDASFDREGQEIYLYIGYIAASAPASLRGVLAGPRGAGSAHSASGQPDPLICSGPALPRPVLRNQNVGEAFSSPFGNAEYAKDSSYSMKPGMSSVPTALSPITLSSEAVSPNSIQPNKSPTAGTPRLTEPAMSSSSSSQPATVGCPAREDEPLSRGPLDPQPASPASEESVEGPTPSSEGLHVTAAGSSGPLLEPVEAAAAGSASKESPRTQSTEEVPSPPKPSAPKRVVATCFLEHGASSPGRPEGKHPHLQTGFAKVHPASPTSASLRVVAEGPLSSSRIVPKFLHSQVPSGGAREQRELPCVSAPNIQSLVPAGTSLPGSTFRVWQEHDIPPLALPDMAEVHVWARLFQSSVKQRGRGSPLSTAPHALHAPTSPSLTFPSRAGRAPREDPAAPEHTQARSEDSTCSQATQTDDVPCANLLALQPQALPPSTSVHSEADSPAEYKRPDMPPAGRRCLTFDKGFQVDCGFAGALLPPSSQSTSRTDLRHALCPLSPAGSRGSHCVSTHASRSRSDSSPARDKARSPRSDEDMQEGWQSQLVRDDACSAAGCADQAELADILREALGKDLMQQGDALLRPGREAGSMESQGIGSPTPQPAPMEGPISDDPDPLSHRQHQIAQVGEGAWPGSDGSVGDAGMVLPRAPSPLPAPPLVKVNETASQTDFAEALVSAFTSQRVLREEPHPQLDRGRLPKRSPIHRYKPARHLKAWTRLQARLPARVPGKRPILADSTLASSPPPSQNPRISLDLAETNSCLPGECSTETRGCGAFTVHDSLQGQRMCATAGPAMDSAGIHIAGDAGAPLIYVPVQVWVLDRWLDVIPVPALPLPLHCGADGAVGPVEVQKSRVHIQNDPPPSATGLPPAAGPTSGAAAAAAAETARGVPTPQAGDHAQAPAPSVPGGRDLLPHSQQVGMQGPEAREASTGPQRLRAGQAPREAEPGAACLGLAARLHQMWHDVAALHPLTPLPLGQAEPPYRDLSGHAPSPADQRPDHSQEPAQLHENFQATSPGVTSTQACFSTAPASPARIQSAGFCIALPTDFSLQAGMPGECRRSNARGTQLEGPCFSNTKMPVVDDWSLPHEAEPAYPTACSSVERVPRYQAEGMGCSGTHPPPSARRAATPPRDAAAAPFRTPPSQHQSKDCAFPPPVNTDSSCRLPTWLSQGVETCSSWPSGLQKEDGESLVDDGLLKGSGLNRWASCETGDAPGCPLFVEGVCRAEEREGPAE